MDRPGFRKLIKDMETGQVDILVVWRLDRLGRTAKGLTSLFEDLVRWKVNLISLKDGLHQRVV
jgi:DNA invertase Pin-like site-specific DNA recombinase